MTSKPLPDQGASAPNPKDRCGRPGCGQYRSEHVKRNNNTCPWMLGTFIEREDFRDPPPPAPAPVPGDGQAPVFANTPAGDAAREIYELRGERDRLAGEVERLREALSDAEKTLRGVSSYVGLLAQHAPDLPTEVHVTHGLVVKALDRSLGNDENGEPT